MITEIILLTYAIFSIAFTSYDPVSIGSNGGVAMEIVREAHHYHGILNSYKDETGAWFMRDGQRLKLFTNGFLKNFESK